MSEAVYVLIIFMVLRAWFTNDGLMIKVNDKTYKIRIE